MPRNSTHTYYPLVSSNGRTEYIATNDLSQSDADATRQECRVRWKIEQLHREIKQVTGIGKCQCRKLRAQRNHIACCFQVRVCLKSVARKHGPTIVHLSGYSYGIEIV